MAECLWWRRVFAYYPCDALYVAEFVTVYCREQSGGCQFSDLVSVKGNNRPLSVVSVRGSGEELLT